MEFCDSYSSALKDATMLNNRCAGVKANKTPYTTGEKHGSFQLGYKLLGYAGDKGPNPISRPSDRYQAKNEEWKKWGLEQVTWCRRVLYDWMKEQRFWTSCRVWHHQIPLQRWYTLQITSVSDIQHEMALHGKHKWNHCCYQGERLTPVEGNPPTILIPR